MKSRLEDAARSGLPLALNDGRELSLAEVRRLQGQDKVRIEASLIRQIMVKGKVPPADAKETSGKAGLQPGRPSPPAAEQPREAESRPRRPSAPAAAESGEAGSQTGVPSPPSAAESTPTAPPPCQPSAPNAACGCHSAAAEPDPIAADPNALRIHGAWIHGELDLANLPSDSKLGLELKACLIDSPLKLCDAGLPRLHLENCVVPAVIANRAQLGIMTVRGCSFEGPWPRERLALDRVHVINDLLLLADTQIDSPTGSEGLVEGVAPATVRLTGANIGGQLSIDHTTRISCTTAGDPELRGIAAALWMSGATVGGPLRLSGMLTSAQGPAVLAENLTVNGDALLGEGSAKRAWATGAGERGALCLRGATVTGKLSLSGSKVANASGPAIVANLATIKGGAYLDGGFEAEGSVWLPGATVTGGLSLEGATVTSAAARSGENATSAAVWLTGATVTGTLVMRGAKLTSHAGPALLANYLTVNGDALLCRDADRPFAAKGAGPLGRVSLAGTTITGTLRMAGALLTDPDDSCQNRDPALVAELLIVKAGAFLDREFCAAGGVRLWGATISDQLSFEGASIKTSATAVEDPGDAAAVWLSTATVGGQLVLRGATLTSEHGPALLADYLTVNGDAFLCEGSEPGLTADGVGPLGVVCLAGASITGQLTMRNSTLTNVGNAAPALLADLLNVKGATLLDARFTANGSVRLWGATFAGRLSFEDATIKTTATPVGEPGYAAAVWLSTATVGGQLVLRRATLTSEHGAALMADRLTVNGDAFLCRSDGEVFTARGVGTDGAICLRGASITGDLALHKASVINRSDGPAGPAFMADEASIQGSALLDTGFSAQGKFPGVSLVNATVGKELSCTLERDGEPSRLALTQTSVGTLILQGSDAQNLSRAQRRMRRQTGEGPLVQDEDKPLLDLDGLTYKKLPSLSKEQKGPAAVQDWITLLRRANYAPQPYQALAAAYGATGDDLSARKMMIAQRDDARARGNLKPLSVLYQRLLGIVIGYGYKSTRALMWLAGVLAITIIIAAGWFAPSGYIVAPSTSSSLKSTSSSSQPACTFPGDFNYAIGLAFPIITLNTSDTACQPSPTAPDSVIIFGWVVRIFAATLASFYVAGLAGITRNPPSS